jgi:3-dehydroquinate synthase
MNNYPIIIGRGLLTQPKLLQRYIRGQQVLIVTNRIVAKLYLSTLMHTLNTIQSASGPLQVDSIILPDGEQYKNLNELNKIFTKLLKTNHHRSTTMLALGGGVIGDMTGFAAACYQRGVAYVQIPTTLLAQVDSSVGGKTAVNHPLGKNMVGAFYQPRAVLIDLETLNSLPAREFSAGMAEVIKHAFIADGEFFSWLETHARKIWARDATRLKQMIDRSCAIKMKIVTMDEKERRKGPRMWLNFGHTVGHAIEAAFGYGVLLHGEAVAIGMCVEAALSHQKVRLPRNDIERLTALLTVFQLPVQMPRRCSSSLLARYLRADKKNRSDCITVALVRQIGHTTVVENMTVTEILALM